MSQSFFYYSNQAFNIASVIYAVAFLLYCGSLVSEKPLYDTGAPWLGRLGWATHTTALILRWMHAGIAHPPWTNLYESLVFFSWAVMGVHLILEWKRGFKITGVLATAVVFAAMGVASLHPHKEIEPLVPALQSWWLLFHVFMASIAYAFFLASSFVSVFYLMQDRIKQETMMGVAGLVCILFLAIAAGKSFFLGGDLQFFKVTQMNGQDVIMNFKGQDGKPMQEFVRLPYAATFLWSLLGIYSVASLVLLTQKKAQKLKAARSLWIAGLVVHFIFLVNIFISSKRLPEMALKSNPYKLSAFIMTFGLAVFFYCLFKFEKQILKKLPKPEVLDRWSYEAIFLGVPFMTLNLVSGAIWAYYAWGRYWGWDPKETWALITWFIYLIYLHMRMLGGWKGRKTALISVAGFFVVIFTYLGVNLVISGLHSYATS